MFLSERSTQAETFDSAGRPFGEVAADYRHLARVNRLFFFSHPFVTRLPGLAGREACRDLTLLDVGAGDGSLGRTLACWAAKRGWNWRFTNFEASQQALKLVPAGTGVLGSALELPFPDNHFDVVMASQMTHHLAGDAEIARHFSEAWRVAARGVLLSDLHRNAGLYALVWMGVRLLRFPRPLAKDGAISVRRGFRVPEWRRLAEQAGISGARVWLYYGTRIILEARKASAIA